MRDAILENVTGSGLHAAVLFLLGVAAVLVSFQKGVEAFRMLFRKKQEDRERRQDERITALEGSVAALGARMEKGDKEFDKLRADIGELLSVQSAMLTHFISGNSADKLRETKRDLDEYLSGR